MNHVVAEVAEEKAAKWSGRESSENKEEESVKNRRNRNTERRRRDQPGSVLRIIMVRAVDEKVESFSETGFRFVMKKTAVHHVFGERPDEDAKREQTCRRADRQSARPKREIFEVGDHR